MHKKDQKTTYDNFVNTGNLLKNRVLRKPFEEVVIEAFQKDEKCALE